MRGKSSLSVLARIVTPGLTCRTVFDEMLNAPVGTDVLHGQSLLV